MKKFVITCLLLLTIVSESKAATCIDSKGWKVVTSELIHPSRVPGNTLVYVSNPEGEVVLSFSATSSFSGKIPYQDFSDSYEIENIWVDQLGLQSLHWSGGESSCPRCDPWGSLNWMTLKTDLKTIYCGGVK